MLRCGRRWYSGAGGNRLGVGACGVSFIPGSGGAGTGAGGRGAARVCRGGGAVRVSLASMGVGDLVCGWRGSNWSVFTSCPCAQAPKS